MHQRVSPLIAEKVWQKSQKESKNRFEIFFINKNSKCQTTLKNRRPKAIRTMTYNYRHHFKMEKYLTTMEIILIFLSEKRISKKPAPFAVYSRKHKLKSKNRLKRKQLPTTETAFPLTKKAPKIKLYLVKDEKQRDYLPFRS